MTAPFSIPFANCRTVFVDGIQTDHLREALRRYPGQRLADDTFPAVQSSTPAGQILDGCVFAVGPEMPGEALVTSFLLRVIEVRWRHQGRNCELVDLGAVLVTPPSMAAEIAAAQALIDGYADVVCGLARDGAQASDAEVRLLAKLCKCRETTLVMACEGLERMVDLKRLHDALHGLQVMGAEAMRPTPGPTPDPASAHATAAGGAALAGLAPLVAATEALLAEDFGGLDTAGQEALGRCRGALALARGLLAATDPAQVAYAPFVLREMLRTEMPALETAIFAEAAAFPFRGLVDEFERARAENLFDYDTLVIVALHDTLLRRVLAHSVWQYVDLGLYAIEEAMRAPLAADWFDRVVDGLQPLEFALRRLVPDRAVKLPSDVLRAAIERYEALDHDAGYAALCAALDETSRRVRGQFIEVDQQLKRDFLLLGGLRAGIGRILGRVPEYCSLNGQ